MSLCAAVIEDMGVSPMMVEDEPDSLMDQPVTKWHDLRNQLHEVLVRLAVITERQTSETQQGHRIEEKVQDVHTKLDGLSRRVTELEQQFGPVKTVVYGMIVLIVTGVIGALLAMVIR